MPPLPPAPWPALSPGRAEELERRALDAAVALAEVADRVTVYPGGGAPAHQAREAARLALDAAARIRDLHPFTDTPDLVRRRIVARQAVRT